ncbi:MAG: hypothetical protein JW919_05480 [Candidatus Omnitrophica bacterium]|nr:hypothetical protein [Candidatus Omnitrophota bacterium]
MRYAIVVMAVLFVCASACGFEQDTSGAGGEGEQLGSGRAVQFEQRGGAQVGQIIDVDQSGGGRKEKVLSVDEGPGGEQTIKTYDPQSGKYWLYKTEGEGASEGSDEGGGFGAGAGSGGNEW